MKPNAPPSGSLEGRIALVTGAAHRLGRSLALAFADAGAHVIIHYHTSQNAAESLVAAIEAKGQRGLSVSANLADAAQAETALREAIETMGGLDILVNNAAILRPHSVGKLTEAEFDEVFGVNTRAAVFLCQAAHPLLIRSEVPAIVNVTAACAHQPMRGLGAYCASKAAMRNFTSTLAQEWAKDGIRVNALTPGSVATDMILPTDPEKRASFEEDMAEQNLMKRLAEPREIARAIRFLASPAASYMTGQTLVVDGGLLA